MLLYISLLESNDVTHLLIKNRDSLEECARNKKDVEHMFVDGDLTMRLHYFGLSRGPYIRKIYVPFRSSSQTFIYKCNNGAIHRMHYPL